MPTRIDHGDHDVPVILLRFCLGSRKPGFGLTINIINGGIECNQPTPPQVTDRVGFYQRYCQILSVAPGSELYCDKMRSY